MQMRGQRLAYGLAGAGAFLAQQPRGGAQLGGGDPSARRRHDGVARPGHDHEFVGQPGFHGQLGLFARPLDQGQVQLEVHHLGGDGQCVGDGDVGGPLRLSAVRQVALETRQQSGQHVVADGGAGADAQYAHVALAVAGPALDRGGAVQQLARLGQQFPAVVVEHQALAYPVEQGHVQGPLQVVQRRAGGGLGQRHGRGGGAGAAGVRDGGEYLQLAQGQAQGFHITRITSFPA